MSEYLLSARKINREFFNKKDSIRILQDTSLFLSENERVAIIGKSGSGKSTLLHLLGGLDVPNSGKIFYKDISLYDSSSNWQSKYRRNHIGFIFQSYHLLSEFNIIENIALPAISTLGRKKSIELAYELVEIIGLTDRINHRPQELSGGEKQRVAIARSLINNPDIVLADEPTGNLDEDTSKNILNYLFKLIEDRGNSLILVTHDINIAKLCQRILLLEDGVLKEV